MKHILILLMSMAWLFFGSAGISAAEPDLRIDFSLGSEIGDNISADEIMPFWAQAEAGLILGDSLEGLRIFVPAGHTSSADVNQGVEYSGEYYGVGGELLIGIFDVKAQVVKYSENALERESTKVQMYEVGFNTALRGVPFRVAAFYENAKSGYLERMGLKFGYEIDLF